MEDILERARTVLKTTPERWLNLAEMLPEGLLAAEPAPGEWSAVGCLRHLVDIEHQVFLFRVRAILAGQDFPAYDPDAEGSLKAGDQKPIMLAWEFNQMRRESLKQLSEVAASDLGRQARHPELGLVTLGELIHEWAGHDLMHTVQAERALMQPFIQGCGPWKRYFADHAVK